MRRRRWSWRNRIYVVAGLTAAVVGLVLYLMPRPVTEIVSIDGQHRSRESSAPPRRKIVWQPSKPLETVPEPASANDSLLRPCLAEGGSALYFTMRHEDGSADIYRSQWSDGRWQAAHPIDEVNSESDDIGPTLSADGRELYFWSNRPGGLGGFDIYVAPRTDNGWSKPRNLGPGINTPAHDQDAALSADGKLLYLSSNRTRRMQKEIGLPRGDVDEVQNEKPWSATLRADQGLQQFDLYVADQDEAGKWQKPYPLGGANTRGASEGEPFASSSGVFLYFASNRPNASGDTDNFDIYRGRVVPGGLVDIENLGSGVNSAADEHEPALSPEGFRIVFSTNRTERSGADQTAPRTAEDLYVLHESIAVETYEDMAWDASRLNGWIVWVNNNTWWILLGLLLLALLASLIWYAREVSLGRATVPGFVLAALLIHLMLGLGSFFVYFSDDIVATIENAMEEVLVASNLHQSHEAGQASYEKVADLQAVETVQPTEVFRQTTEMSSVPVPTESRIPTLPTTVGPEIPQQQLAETPQTNPSNNPQLQRRRFTPTQEMIAQETVKLQQTQAADSRQPNQPKSNDVAVNRQSATAPPIQTQQNTSITAAQPTRVDPVHSEPVQPAMEQPATSSPAQPNLPTRTTASPMEFADASPTIQPVEVSATPSTTPQTESIPGTAVEFSRSAADQVSLNTARMPTSVTSGEPAINSQIRADRIAVRRSDRASVPLPSGNETATPQDAMKTAFPVRSRVRPSMSDITEGEVMVAPVPQTDSGDGTPNAAASPSEAVAVSRQNSPRSATPSQSFQPIGVPVSLAAAPAADSSISASNAGFTSTPANSPIANPLNRRTTARDVSVPSIGEIAMIDTGIPSESSSPSNKSQGVASTSVQVTRSDASPLQLPIPASSRLGGRTLLRNPNVVIGTLATEANHIAPSLSPITSQIMRRPARAPLLDYAEDNIGLQSMLRLRGADLETKQDLVQAFGGDDRVLETISRGLNWIQKHQHPDGHWSLHRFEECCEGHRCNGRGDHASDTGGTGLALLPLLGDGHTHVTGDYQSNVKRALDWLIEHQKDDGDLFTGGHSNARMYSHGIAAIALCEAYGMTKDPELKEPAQKALDFIVYAQHQEGGWRYAPKQAGDTSVMGWQIMAMKSGQIAGLQAPTATLDKARQWLFKNQGRGRNTGRFAYQGTNGTPPMTAEALLCLQYLGIERDDPHVLNGTKYMLEHLPRSGQESSYYWYYGTQVMYHMQGDYWQQWNDSLRDMVIESQVRDGSMAGTWDPKDRWEKSGGRLYSTSLRLLMLEVYYRHLPLYQALQ